jgi:eukaryotic-like serine/threonine-protein kinase
MPTPHSCAQCLAQLPEPLAGDDCPFCGSRVAADTPRAVETPFSSSRTPDTPLPDTPVFPLALSAEPAATAVVGQAGPRVARLPVLAGYELRRVLGAGGMGIVYEAVQKRIGRVVALKVVQKCGHLNGQQAARFDIEAKALGKLTHPNVVPVYEVGEEDGVPYFSMEHVAGGSLAERVRGGQRVPADEAAALIAAVAAGVDQAHKAGVLHRDLKPANILLAADGTPKVADFGLAKLLDRDDGPTYTGAAVGTPSYMAPEQVHGPAADLGPPTDVYGLGATLYHLLTGRPPFRDDTPMGTAVRVLSEEPAPPRAVCPDLCPVLDAIVRKAMAKAPADRYPTAAALATDLTAWRADGPTVARPLTRRERAARWARRHRMKLAAAVLLPLLLGAAAIARREADPKRQLERKLADGQTVTLVGATGKPAWSRWEMGDANLSDSIDGDGTCGFQTHDVSLLELCADPGPRPYRFAADLRHLGGTDDNNTMIGVYIGCGHVREGETLLTRRYLSFEFDDFWSPAQRLKPGLKASHGLEAVDHFDIYNRGKRVPHTVSDTNGPRFQPSANPPWRRIVVEVTPDGATATWRKNDGGPSAPFLIPRGWFTRNTPVIGRWADQALGPGVVIPDWSPRGPLGIFATDSKVAFRNVTITPILEP